MDFLNHSWDNMADNEDAEARMLKKLEKDDAQPAQIV